METIKEINRQREKLMKETNRMYLVIRNKYVEKLEKHSESAQKMP